MKILLRVAYFFKRRIDDTKYAFWTTLYNFFLLATNSSAALYQACIPHVQELARVRSTDKCHDKLQAAYTSAFGKTINLEDLDGDVRRRFTAVY